MLNDLYVKQFALILSKICPLLYFILSYIQKVWKMNGDVSPFSIPSTFKVTVLEGYYNDPETHGNQRKTALKYGVNRRQIQKWLAQVNQQETLLTVF